MDGRTFLYGLWSLATIGLFLTATAYSWSPFANGGRVAPRPGVYGPTHK